MAITATIKKNMVKCGHFPQLFFSQSLKSPLIRHSGALKQNFDFLFFLITYPGFHLDSLENGS